MSLKIYSMKNNNFKNPVSALFKQLMINTKLFTILIIYVDGFIILSASISIKHASYMRAQ